MDYLTASEMALRWGISSEVIRRHCRNNRINGAYQENGIWFIPANAPRPARKEKEALPKPKSPTLLNKIIHQRYSTNYTGLYDYVQVNMAYSNCRLASNRMTREQVEALYKTDKITFLNEPLKVNDLIEVRNQFRCLDYILDQAMTPLTQTMIRKLHALTLADGWGHKRRETTPGTYRKYAASPSFTCAVPAEKINEELGSLVKAYEATERIEFRDILDFHVRFERIRPFDDCNGRVGRMIMFKECLRHGITPFILDDKRRHQYLEGIRHWDEDPDILTEVCLAAQDRFSAQIDLQELLKRHGEFTRMRKHEEWGEIE